MSPEYLGVYTQPSPRKPREGEAVAAIWFRASEFEQLGTVPTADPREAVCVELMSKIGPLLVHGSIIPYHGYKGATGQSAQWVEHKRAIAWHREDWLRLRSQFPHHHLIAAGDYNQHRDGVGTYGSHEVRNLLSMALQDADLLCVTEEDFVANGKLTRHNIDHVCMTSALATNLIQVDAWEGTLEGKRLSDHNGVLVSINTNLSTVQTLAS